MGSHSLNLVNIQQFKNYTSSNRLPPIVCFHAKHFWLAIFSKKIKNKFAKVIFIRLVCADSIACGCEWNHFDVTSEFVQTGVFSCRFYQIHKYIKTSSAMLPYKFNTETMARSIVYCSPKTAKCTTNSETFRSFQPTVTVPRPK